MKNLKVTIEKNQLETLTPEQLKHLKSIIHSKVKGVPLGICISTAISVIDELRETTGNQTILAFGSGKPHYEIFKNDRDYEDGIEFSSGDNAADALFEAMKKLL